MSESYDFARDLREARLMIENLETYVRGDELYQSVGGFFSKMPSLTAGAVLMRLRRLHELHTYLDDAQRQTLAEIQQTFEGVRDDWRKHYEDKLSREAYSRLNAMQNFFRECRDSLHNCSGMYRPEMLRRTIIEEIIFEMTQLKLADSDLAQQVRATDGKLRGVLRSDSFQWADVLRPAYPENTYWWLYGKPPAE